MTFPGPGRESHGDRCHEADSRANGRSTTEAKDPSRTELQRHWLAPLSDSHCSEPVFTRPLLNVHLSVTYQSHGPHRVSTHWLFSGPDGTLGL